VCVCDSVNKYTVLIGSELTVSQEGSNGALENGTGIELPTPYLG